MLSFFVIRLDMLKKISHIITSILLVVATTGITVSVHYCHEQLIDYGIFSEAETCCTTGMNDTGHMQCSPEMTPGSHCEHKTISVEPVEDFFSVSPDIQIKAKVINLFAILPVVSIEKSSEFNTSLLLPSNPGELYPPPVKGKISLIQSFLL